MFVPVSCAPAVTWPPVPMVKLPVVMNASLLKSTVPVVAVKLSDVQPSVKSTVFAVAVLSITMSSTVLSRKFTFCAFAPENVIVPVPLV